MHMSDSLLSPSVGAAMFAASAAAVGYSAAKIKADGFCDKKAVITGAAGAFVFASQMINFAIPGTGSSGHIGGGILLAALIGAFPAMIAMSAVLTVQCLMFADGGLLALGANIFNLGVIPCLIVYPLVFKPLAGDGLKAGKTVIASMTAAIVGLQLGAFGVVLQAQASGIAELPFAGFAGMMLPIHLAIGLAEGAATAAVLCLVYRARPEIITSAVNGTRINGDARIGKVAAAFAVAALAVGGALSLFASSNPDGLEWAIAKVAGNAEFAVSNPMATSAASIQARTAVMPGYAFKGANGGGFAGTTTAGIVGSAAALALAWGAAFAFARAKRRLSMGG